MNRYLVIGFLVVLAYAGWERGRYLETRAEFDDFIAKAQILADERIAENQQKEMEYAERLKTAELGHAAAVNRLRQYTERPRQPGVPGSPQTADADTICWSTDRFDTALRELEAIVTSGQEAVIDRTTLLGAWPE